MPIHRFPGGVVNADNVTPGANQASGVWTLESQLQANGTGFWPQSTSQMSRSLRFNSADSAYLTRTPTVTGNRKTWTWSGWVKRCTTGSNDELFVTGSSDGFVIRFNSTDTIRIYSYTGTFQLHLITSAVYRDPSSWYHVVLSIDTTQATDTNRARLFINGVQVTAFGTAVYPSQNQDLLVNQTIQHSIGSNLPWGSTYSNIYLTEVVFVDGQALDATSFGYTDSNNVWQPKPYSGSVGTNGFYLTFADNTGVTPTTLGKDYSNRGNNWTPVNFSVASGAGNDSLVDVPTNWGTDTGLGGEVRGNYATLNPLNGIPSGGSISNGNLTCTTPTTGAKGIVATFDIPVSGKWYWEYTPTNNGSESFCGIGPLDNYTPGVIYYGTGQKYVDGSASAYGASYTTNDTIGVAVNVDSGSVTFYKNGVSQGAITYSTTAGKFPCFLDGSGGVSSTFDVNFGQRPFAYAAPSGFKVLCTQNLPTPTVQNGGLYFNPVLYLGNGSTQSITGVGFQPDFVWVKDRTQSANHRLFDAVRGASKILYSSLTNSETTDANGLTSFNSNGFSVGSSQINDNNYNYVAWNWKANGAGSSNTAGSITSTVSVNTTSGFSVVTYTGNGSTGTIGHGLGVAPSMIIIKVRSTTNDWGVGHASVGWSQAALLNLTNAFGASSYFNSTAPTSTVFSVGNNAVTNANSATYVAYCFAPIAGYSAFGSYTGNGSTNGPFIYTGFRPALIMMKASGATGAWTIFDSKRNPSNGATFVLQPNSSAAEGTFTSSEAPDLLSNGFRLNFSYADYNSNGVTYIYAAFAENPFKIARAR